MDFSSVESRSNNKVKVVDEKSLSVELPETAHQISQAMRLERLFEEFGCVAKLRTDEEEKKKPCVTDNSNYIVDLYLKKDIGDLKVASESILGIAGVVEHGMFIDMATIIIPFGYNSISHQFQSLQ